MLFPMAEQRRTKAAPSLRRSSNARGEIYFELASSRVVQIKALRGSPEGTCHNDGPAERHIKSAIAGQMDKLRQYIKEVMDKRGVSVTDIARQSGGAIKRSYIFDILSGKTKYISVDKLQALALGLQMDSVELFKIATGYTPSSDPCSETLLLIKSVLTMTPKERKALLAHLKKS